MNDQLSLCSAHRERIREGESCIVCDWAERMSNPAAIALEQQRDQLLDALEGAIHAMETLVMVNGKPTVPSGHFEASYKKSVAVYLKVKGTVHG